MAAPSYAYTPNTANSTDPAGDILTLIEARLTAAGWVFIEEVAYTSGVAKLMRVWKNPASLNVAGVDFFVGFIKNAVAGTLLSARAFEGWDTGAKTMNHPCIAGSATTIYPLLFESTNIGLPPVNNVNFRRGGGVYLAWVNTGGLWTSTDCINWTSLAPSVLPFNAAGAYNDLQYGNGVWVAVGNGNRIVRSFDNGVTWETMSTSFPAGTSWTRIAYGNGIFTAIAFTVSTPMQAVTSSDNGATWTLGNVAFPLGSYSAFYANGLFFVSLSSTATATYYTSPDGLTWTTRTLPVSGGPWKVAYGNGTWMVSGTTSQCYTSPDCITWTSRTMPAAVNAPAYLIFHPGLKLFIASQGGSTACSYTVNGSGTFGVFNRPTGTFPLLATDTGFIGVSTASATQSWKAEPTNHWWADAVPYAATAAATAVAEILPTAVLITATNYHVSILASKSYVVIGVALASNRTVVISWVLGLYNPIAPEAQSNLLPLAALSLPASNLGVSSGVSRAVRTYSPTNAFTAGVGPESIMLGAIDDAGNQVQEPASGLLRVARVCVGGDVTAGFSLSGFRGWLYDCVAFPQKFPLGATIANTPLQIGPNTYTQIAAGSTNTTLYASGTKTGFFFDLAAGT